VDGKGIACVWDGVGGAGSAPSYFLFENGHVYRAWVPLSLPLGIERTEPVKYETSVKLITWKFESSPGHHSNYTFHTSFVGRRSRPLLLSQDSNPYVWSSPPHLL